MHTYLKYGGLLQMERDERNINSSLRRIRSIPEGVQFRKRGLQQREECIRQVLRPMVSSRYLAVPQTLDCALTRDVARAN